MHDARVVVHSAIDISSVCAVRGRKRPGFQLYTLQQGSLEHLLRFSALRCVPSSLPSSVASPARRHPVTFRASRPRRDVRHIAVCAVRRRWRVRDGWCPRPRRPQGPPRIRSRRSRRPRCWRDIPRPASVGSPAGPIPRRPQPPRCSHRVLDLLHQHPPHGVQVAYGGVDQYRLGGRAREGALVPVRPLE